MVKLPGLITLSMRSAAVSTALLALAIPADAAVIPDPLVPYTQVAEPFFGVTHYQITQGFDAPSSAPFPRPLAIHLVEIDLSVAGVSFLGTPSNGATINEYTRQTTSSFVSSNGLAVGINGDFFTTNTGITANVNGLGMSNGNIVSPPAAGDDRDNSLVTFMDNTATIISDPIVPFGAENAISGNQLLLRNGVNVTPGGSYTTTLNPHTAAGIDADTGNVFFMVVDGRQADFSAGMRTDEMAQLFLDFGVDDAINLDGGGSSTLVFADGLSGAPRVVNSPSDGATGQQPGYERLVANHFGLTAVPNPNYVPISAPPRPPLPDADPLLTELTIIDGFDGGEGRYGSAPNFSGTTRGITAASTADYVTDEAHRGDGSQRLMLDRNGATDARVRHVSSVGRPEENRVVAGGQLAAMGTEGFVGFFLKTTESDLAVSIAIDDGVSGGTTGLEISAALDVIADGEWHLYEFDLADDVVWSNFASGDGRIGGPNAYIDSIVFYPGASTTNSTVEVYLDTVAYNPSGSLSSLNIIPEPTTTVLLATTLAGTAARTRRSCSVSSPSRKFLSLRGSCSSNAGSHGCECRPTRPRCRQRSRLSRR